MLPFFLVHPCPYVVGVFLASWATPWCSTSEIATGIEPARLSVKDSRRTGTKNRQLHSQAMISAKLPSGAVSLIRASKATNPPQKNVHFHTLVPFAWDIDGSTITVRIPMTWKRRDGRKVIVARDGGDACSEAMARMARRYAHPCVGTRASVEGAVGREERPIGWGTGRSTECHAQLRQPAAAAHPAGPGHRRGDPGGEAVEGVWCRRS